MASRRQSPLNSGGTSDTSQSLSKSPIELWWIMGLGVATELEASCPEAHEHTATSKRAVAPRTHLTRMLDSIEDALSTCAHHPRCLSEAMHTPQPARQRIFVAVPLALTSPTSLSPSLSRPVPPAPTDTAMDKHRAADSANCTNIRLPRRGDSSGRLGSEILTHAHRLGQELRRPRGASETGKASTGDCYARPGRPHTGVAERASQPCYSHVGTSSWSRRAAPSTGYRPDSTPTRVEKARARSISQPVTARKRPAKSSLANAEPRQ